jgi:NAD(P)-dependent dehydrogenase (short-subunit alcohol dehydrogenase family)
MPVATGPLKERVALVTGGASGIGRATVLGLARMGASVAVVDRDADGVERVANEVATEGGTARAFVVDLADAGALDPLVERVLAALGRIDILVNCAGVTGGVHTALDFSDETFETVMRVNVRAPFMLTRAVGRHMVERGGGGRIVNVSSSSAFRATSSPAVYAASKAAINGLTRTAAGDLGPYDINVNAVAPGVTKTPMAAALAPDDDAYTAMVTSGPLANLLHRASEPDDVANVIVFLCLPESRQITGQVVNTGAGVVV